MTALFVGFIEVHRAAGNVVPGKAVQRRVHFLVEQADGEQVFMEGRVLAKLAGTVGQPVGKLRRFRQHQDASGFDGAKTKNDNPRLLFDLVAVFVNIDNALGLALGIGGHADHIAIGPQIIIAGRQRLGDKGGSGVGP